MTRQEFISLKVGDKVALSLVVTDVGKVRATGEFCITARDEHGHHEIFVCESTPSIADLMGGI